jgi:hypothetical protein
MERILHFSLRLSGCNEKGSEEQEMRCREEKVCERRNDMDGKGEGKRRRRRTSSYKAAPGV